MRIASVWRDGDDSDKVGACEVAAADAVAPAGRTNRVDGPGRKRRAESRKLTDSSCPPGRPRLGFLAAWLCSAFVALLAVPAYAQTDVPSNWPLIPSGLNAGDEFRLLLVTKRPMSATSSDISDYDAHVQSNISERGHAHIRAYAGNFKVLGSTATVNVRSHTGTTGTGGVPIYWIRGLRVADDYADFFDGSWANKQQGRYEDSSRISGRNRDQHLCTGTADDGTTTTLPLSGADPDGDGVSECTATTINTTTATLSGRARDTSDSPRYLALSGVFRVAAAHVVLIESVEITSDSGGDKDYEAGDEIEITVTFSEAVAVTGTPRLKIKLNGTRMAEYVGSGSTAADLVFSYTVTDRDYDLDGVSLPSNGLRLNGGTIKSQADGTDALLDLTAVPGGPAYTWFDPPAWEDISPHRVHNRPALTGSGVGPPLTGVSVASNPAVGSSYSTGETILIDVHFDKPMRVITHEGVPTYEITFGWRRREAHYTEVVGGNTVRFAYEVQSNDYDEDGLSASERAIRWNGGLITRNGVHDDITLALRAKDDHTALISQFVHKVNALDTTMAPVIVDVGPFTVSENQTAVATLTATDEDTASADLVWTIEGGADESAFELSTAGVLTFAEAKDYEAPDDADADGAYEVDVMVTDGVNRGLFATAALLTVRLADVDEVTVSEQIWTTTLTVEARDGFRGYSLVANPDAGSVSNRLFDYGSAYEVLILVAYSDGVVFRVRNRGENLSELVLEWAGTTLPLNAATRAGNQYTWSPAWLDAHAASLNASSYASTLPENGTGTVCLRTSEQTCPATTITGGSAVVAAQITVPLTAVLSNVPAEHDGETAFWLELSFNAAVVEGSKPRIRALLGVTGGSETRIRRKDGRLDRWRIRIEPSSHAAVTVTLSPSPACGATGAVCTEDGRTYTTALATTIHGPVGISVADTTVQEGADAQLDFVVSLSRAAASPVTVDYLTRDGTAIAGQDFTGTSGTLTFAAGETSKTIAVPVLDDVHDEGSETMKLKLSTASGAQITDRQAIGTITNSDPLQRAWLSRFGRTVGTHVTDAVGERLRTPSGQASQVTVGGYRLPLGQQAAGRDPATTTKPETATDRLASLLTGLVGQALGLGPAQPEGGGLGADPWADQPGTDPRLGQSQLLQLPTVRLRDVLLGSSFRLALAGDDARDGAMRLTAWGRVTGTRFDGRDGALSLDGDVFTGTVGIDGTWGRWLLGLAAAQTQADGTFAGDGMSDLGQGALDNTLTSIHPYVQYAVTDRLNLWGMVGYGWGDTEVTIGHTETLESDTNFLMGAVGGRGVLLAAAETGGFELATRSDAMLTQTSLDDTAGMVGAEGTAHRLRVVLEGSRGFTWPEGRTLTPTVEVGLRHDWGDAETGFGLEVGGRVQYADPRLGLTVDGTVRGLVAHEASEYDEWGASANVRLAPGMNGQGLSLTLSPTWGAASSGIDGLWSRQTTVGLAPQGNRAVPTGRLNAEIGYGVAAPFSPGLLTPYAGTVLTDGAARTYRLGTRWTTLSGLTLNLEAQRQESPGQQPPNQALHLQIGWGF